MRNAPWKKIAVSAVVVAASVGTGAAWAQSGGENGGPEQPAQADTRMTGGGTTETKFVPVEPCRLVDTRAAGGKFAHNDTRRFKVRGTGTTFANQGGKAGGCDIPRSGVNAVEITITAVDPVGNGFLRAFPGSVPAASFLNYSGGINGGNTGTVALCGADGSLCVINKDLGIKNYSGNTHVVVDVFGYYAQPLSAVVKSDGTTARGSRDVSSTTGGTGIRYVTFDRDVSQCAYAVSVGNATAGSPDGFATATPKSTEDDAVYVEVFDASGNNANLGFHLTVTC